MKKINAFITERLRLNKNFILKDNFSEWLESFIYMVDEKLKENQKYITDSENLLNKSKSLLSFIKTNEIPFFTCFEKIESTNQFNSKISLFFDLELFDDRITIHDMDDIDEIYLTLFDDSLVVEIWYNEKMNKNTKNFIISYSQKKYNSLYQEFDSWKETNNDKLEEIIKLKKK